MIIEEAIIMKNISDFSKPDFLLSIGSDREGMNMLSGTEEKNVVLDTNVLLELFKIEGMSFKLILKALNIILAEEKLKGILILDSSWSELEGLKKRKNELSEVAAKVCSKIGKALDNGGTVRYSDVEKHPNGVDDSLIDYCVRNDELFVTFDIRADRKYRSRASKEGSRKITKGKIIKTIELHEKLDQLTDKNLNIYLQKMFDSRVVSTTEYIQLTGEERFIALVNFVIGDTLKGEEEEFVYEVKSAIAQSKEGSIDNNVLNKNLIKLKGYDFGYLKIEKPSLKEKFKELIERFLNEKNFSSFEELKKYHPFKKEDELITGIIEYYGVEEKDEREGY